MHIFLSREALLRFGEKKKNHLTKILKILKFLRFLDMGHSVLMLDVNGSPVAVDTEEDLKRAEKILLEKKAL